MTKDIIESKREKCKVILVKIKNKTQTISGIYFIWICIHFITTHLYSQFCTPYSVQGFLMSPFLTASPQCNALRWGIDQGALSINNMWLVIGAWFLSKLAIKKKRD